MQRYYEFQSNVRVRDADCNIEEGEGDSFQTFEENFSNNENDESLTVWVDAIHSITTANYTRYPADELRGDAVKHTGARSWTYPYNKPVMVHHESQDGEPIGRVIESKFEEQSATNGKPCIRLKLKITDKESIQKIKDGRYVTVSVGGHAGKAKCSICGQDVINDGLCEHWPGREYDGEVAELVLGDINFIEVSFVNVPADDHAMIVNIDDDGNKDTTNPYQQKDNEESTSKGGKVMPTQESQNSPQESVSDLKDKIQTLKEEKQDLEKDLKEANSNIDTLENDIADLQEENTELKAKQHQSLVEKVVNKKIELTSKLSQENVDDLKERYSKRSEESLRDTLEDLELEESFLESDEDQEDDGQDVEDDQDQDGSDNEDTEDDEEQEDEDGEDVEDVEDVEEGQVDNPTLHTSEEGNVDKDKEESKTISDRLNSLNI